MENENKVCKCNMKNKSRKHIECGRKMEGYLRARQNVARQSVRRKFMTSTKNSHDSPDHYEGSSYRKPKIGRWVGKGQRGGWSRKEKKPRIFDGNSVNNSIKCNNKQTTNTKLPTASTLTTHTYWKWTPIYHRHHFFAVPKQCICRQHQLHQM